MKLNGAGQLLVSVLVMFSCSSAVEPEGKEDRSGLENCDPALGTARPCPVNSTEADPDLYDLAKDCP